MKDRQGDHADDYRGAGDLLPIKNTDSRRHSSFIDTNQVASTVELPRSDDNNRRFSAGTALTAQTVDTNRTSLGMALKYLKKQNQDHRKISRATTIVKENSITGDVSPGQDPDTNINRPTKNKTVTGNMQGGSESDIDSQSESDERHVELFKPIEAPPGNVNNLMAPKPVKPTPAVTPVNLSENDDSNHEIQNISTNRDMSTGQTKDKEAPIEILLGKIKKLDNKNYDSSPISTPTMPGKTSRVKKEKHLTKYKASELYLSSSDSDSNEPKPRHIRKGQSSSKGKDTLGAEGGEERTTKMKIEKSVANIKKSAFSSTRKGQINLAHMKVISGDKKYALGNELKPMGSIATFEDSSEVASDQKSEDFTMEGSKINDRRSSSSSSSSSSSGSDSSRSNRGDNSSNKSKINDNSGNNSGNKIDLLQSDLPNKNDNVNQQSKANSLEDTKLGDQSIQGSNTSSGKEVQQNDPLQQVTVEKITKYRVDESNTTLEADSAIRSASAKVDIQNDHNETTIPSLDIKNNRSVNANTSPKLPHIPRHKPLSSTTSEDSISKTFENLTLKDNDVSLTDESEFAFDDEQEFDNFEESPQPFTPTTLIDIPEGNEDESESTEEMQAKNKVRIFVALYDYDPKVMSPNPSDVAEEELPFKEGDLIKVIY